MVICFANVLSCIDFVATSSFERCIGHVIDKSISIIRSKTELIIPPPVNFINHCPQTAQYGFFPSDWNELLVIIEGSSKCMVDTCRDSTIIFAFCAIVWVWHICFIAFYWIPLEYSLAYRTIIIGRALKS